ncbi:MAG: radical SAM protein [Vallitaleaceae bacterium]|nr:radical SAM protein [Vallitaleaceae bacterium]
MSKTMNIPIFIPHLGCENDCVFCNQKSISGTLKPLDEEALREYIEASINTRGGRKVEIAFFGGSFTGLPLPLQKSYLDLAKEYVEKYDLQGIRMSTRPDYINEEIMSFLKPYPIRVIELGVQSLDEEVLLQSKRNHSSQDVYQAIRFIRESGIDLGLQMMLGLPGDSEEKIQRTAEEFIKIKPICIRIYPTLVIKGTELEKLYDEGKYVPLSLEQAVAICAEILPKFVEAQIQVIRVGLQANDGLNSEEMIAGPYHPAFRELVEDEMVFQKIKNEVSHRKAEGKALVLSTSKSMNQRIRGHKKANLQRIEELAKWSYELVADLKPNQIIIQDPLIFGEEGRTVLSVFF